MKPKTIIKNDVDNLKEKIRNKKRHKIKRIKFMPRYDDVYFEGVKILEKR